MQTVSGLLPDFILVNYVISYGFLAVINFIFNNGNNNLRCFMQVFFNHGRFNHVILCGFVVILKFWIMVIISHVILNGIMANFKFLVTIIIYHINVLF